jgi:hypothetical protein
LLKQISQLCHSVQAPEPKVVLPPARQEWK